jgi:glucose/arabinose dehydrogenase
MSAPRLTRRTRPWLTALATAALAGAAPMARVALAAPGDSLGVQVVADGFDHPLFLCAAPGDRRLFVVEQPGRIRWIENGRPSKRVFLDASPLLRYGGEQGLLGLAFHPGYATNGFLYVNYTDRSGDTQVVRYTARADRDSVAPGSAKRILTVVQPYANHNGGMVTFGPDGMLYIGMGDGGSGGDPFGNGQNLRTLLGKMLRIDVDHGDPYAIPPGNPFRDRPNDGRAEIWATGLRNPWRFSFDFTARLLIIGDVGQNRYEEIDVVDAARAGANYGWNVREGAHAYGFPRPGPPKRVEPAIEYEHPDGCSVTGGYAYRGRALPALAGTIFYSDYCAGWLRSFRWKGGKASEQTAWNVGNLGSVSSFGEDAERELYVVGYEGKIWKLVAR